MGMHTVNKCAIGWSTTPRCAPPSAQTPSRPCAARQALFEEELHALLAGDVGRLSRMGANNFRPHQFGRFRLLGPDLPSCADLIWAAYGNARPQREAGYIRGQQPVVLIVPGPSLLTGEC
jgi:hypothetical protein